MIPVGILGSARVAAGSTVRTLTFQTSVADIGNLSTYTYTGVPIGSADATRSVLVVGITRTGGGNVAIGAATIGGVAATRDVGLAAVNDVFVLRANVPTGTTADVVIPLGTSATRCHIGVWTVTGGPIALAGTATSTVRPSVLDVTAIAAGDMAVAGAMTNAGPTSTTWANANERFDAVAEIPYTGADAVAAAPGVIAISNTWNTTTTFYAAAAAIYTAA